MLPPHTESRRHARRYALDVPVWLGSEKGRTVDLSSRGVYFITTVHLTVGSTIEMAITLPGVFRSGPVELRLRARVVRQQDLGESRGIGAEIESWELPELARNN